MSARKLQKKWLAMLVYFDVTKTFVGMDAGQLCPRQ